MQKIVAHDFRYDPRIMLSSTYIGGFTVNKTTQGLRNSQNKHETNTTAFTTEHDKFKQGKKKHTHTQSDKIFTLLKVLQM